MTQSTATEMDFGFDERFNAVPGEEVVQVPYAQLMNPGRGEWGLGIKVDQAEAVGFDPDKSWRKVNHTFKGEREAEVMYMCRTPVMGFIKMGERMFCERANKRNVYSFRTDYAKYNGKDHKPFTKTLIMLYGENRQPIIAQPLQLTCSGAAGAALTKSFEVFKDQAQKVAKTMFSAAMKSHLIFAPTFDVDQAGTGADTSEIIVPRSWLVPTADNRRLWQIPTKVQGEENDLSLLILAFREQYTDFGKFTQPQATTPAAQAAVTYDDGDDYVMGGEPPY